MAELGGDGVTGRVRVSTQRTSCDARFSTRFSTFQPFLEKTVAKGLIAVYPTVGVDL